MSIVLAIAAIAAAAAADIAAAGAYFVFPVGFIVFIVIVIAKVITVGTTLLVLHAGGNRHRNLFFLGYSAHHHACRIESNIVHAHASLSIS